MDINYLRQMNDSINKSIFNESLLVDIVINIQGTPINSETNVSNVYESFDAKVENQEKYDFNIDLKPQYKIKVFPVDLSGLALTQANQYAYKPVGFVDSYSAWVSCREKDVRVRDKTYFDYAKNVELHGSTYTLKGIVKDTFGNDIILHVFLGKES